MRTPELPSASRHRAVATKRQVEEKLRELIRRLDEADSGIRGSLATSLPEPRVIQIHLPDIEATYWTVIADGGLERLHRGPAEAADIRVSVVSDDLVELVEGRRSLFSAYLAGHVKIEASLTDLLRLRKLA